MLKSITVSNVEVKVNHKFDNLEAPIKSTIAENIEKWFKQKLDRYVTKFTNPNNLEVHLNCHIVKNTKWLYNGNFNLKIWDENVIYKREWFKNVLDLIGHFFDHAKESLSKK